MEICRSIGNKSDEVLGLLDKRSGKSYTDREVLQILNEVYEKGAFSNIAIADKTLELIQLLNDDLNIKEVN